MKESPIIIVGAGPVGLTLAWRLARSGVPVRVFEAEPGVPDQLRASTWHPPTLDMFQESGVTQVLVDHGRVTPGWQIRMHETGERAAFDLSVIADATGHPYRLQCPQSVLGHELVRRLNAIDPAIVAFSHPVRDVGQSDGDAWADVESPDGDVQRITAPWIVGCDGARSVVRKAMDVTFDGAAYPELTVLVTTHHPFEQDLEGLSGVNYIWKAGGTFSLLRLPDVWRCSFHPDDGESEEEALSDGSLRRKAAEISEAAGQMEILQKRAYKVHRRIAETYRKGCLLLAGDAAHLNSPKGGMGMNGGIHDAFALAAALTAMHDGTGDDRLLDRYVRQRLPIARDDILAQADANRARMNETDPTARRESLRRMQETAADPERCREYLLKASMITGLQRAAAID